MKVGNIIDGLEVLDVKRVRKMHPVQQYKEVCEYLDKGYKIDYKSAKVVGLVHEVDVYKLGEATKEVVDENVEKQPEPIVESAAIEPITEQDSEEYPSEVVEVSVKKTTSRTKKTT